MILNVFYILFSSFPKIPRAREFLLPDLEYVVHDR